MLRNGGNQIEKYGYDKDRHGKVDSRINAGSAERTDRNERIGKKYQWIAMHEILARVSDNCQRYDDWNMKEEALYEGTWDPYVRDIDPTITIKSIQYEDEERPTAYWWSKEKYSNWEHDNRLWIEMVDDLPNDSDLLITLDDELNEWLTLESYPEWVEPKELGDKKWDKPHKRLWYQIRSYIVSETELPVIVEWLTGRSFLGRWMPESPSRYEVFSREFYWSNAYKYFNNHYYSGLEHHKLQDEKTKETIGEVSITANEYFWENERDKSKEFTIRFLRPSNYLFQNMKMQYSKDEGVFLDERRDVLCFDPSVDFDTKSHLLIKNSDLLSFLEKNKLRIIWTILGEKNIIGGRLSSNEFHGRMVISGTYYLSEDNNVTGEIKTNFIKPRSM